MNTLKSAALIVVLLAVLYGVYVALNKPDPPSALDSPAASADAPLIEYSPPPGPSYGSPAPLAPSLDSGASPPSAPSSRHVRGGAFQPDLGPSLPPLPTAPPLTPPDPTTASAASGLQRSAYETPAAPLATEPPPPEPVRQPSSTEGSAAGVAPSANSTASPALSAYALHRDLREADELVRQGKHKLALVKLTPHYFQAELPPEDRAQLLAWLDALASKVIYSREHLLALPHQVRKGETLFDIAQQYNVEYRLLQNINHEVREPDVLVSGTELKVVPGPFRADVNLTASELTLLVGEMYAGRFPFALGDQPPPLGDHKVIDKKSRQKTYIGFDGRVIPANDPNNPYGEFWISLGGEVSVHGSPTVANARPLGCISLSPQDAKDVYGILSIGSDVRIRR